MHCISIFFSKFATESKTFLMEVDSQFILQKEVNWSLLNYGLPIPVSVWNLFHAWDSNILKHGASKQIKIMIGRDMYDAMLINQNFNQQKFSGHRDIIQIRYNENSPIAKRLRAIFYKSYDYLSTQRQLEENNRKQVGLPDNLKEFIRMYFTSIPDVFCIECCTEEEYQQVASTLSRMSEEMYEASDDDKLFIEDKNASIIEKERFVKYRKIDRSIIKTLKEHYGYCDQITGEKIGSRYGESVVEAHHIDYFTTSQNNDTTNIIIISPNYHRIIHRNNPVFNRKKFQFEFPNGEILGLKLYDHLLAKT